MKFKVKRLVLTLTLLAGLPVYAQEPQGSDLLDLILYRPLGLAATVAGCGAFVALVPFTAFANISPPHDAFELTADMLIYKPAGFTFDRPVGVLTPDADGRYRRH